MVKYILAFLVVIGIVIVVFNKQNKNNIEPQEMKTIYMTQEEFSKFKEKFVNLKCGQSLSRVKKILAIEPSEESSVYQPSLFPKKVAITLYYLINNQEFFLDFEPKDKKLRAMGIVSEKGKVIWEKLCKKIE